MDSRLKSAVTEIVFITFTENIFRMLANQPLAERLRPRELK